MSLVDLTNEYYLCDRCGTMVKQDERHECVKGESMRRSKEELEQLPIGYHRYKMLLCLPTFLFLLFVWQLNQLHL